MTSTTSPADAARLASVDTEDKARRRHPTSGGRPPRTPAPGMCWTPLAYSVVIGVCAASAVAWVCLIATTIGLFGELVSRQAELAATLAEVSTRCGAAGTATEAGEAAAHSDALLFAEDPAGPAGRRHAPTGSLR